MLLCGFSCADGVRGGRLLLRRNTGNTTGAQSKRVCGRRRRDTYSGVRMWRGSESSESAGEWNDVRLTLPKSSRALSDGAAGPRCMRASRSSRKVRRTRDMPCRDCIVSKHTDLQSAELRTLSTFAWNLAAPNCSIRFVRPHPNRETKRACVY